MNLQLPAHLRGRASSPVGFSAEVCTSITDKGVTLLVRVVDPRDPFKRSQNVKIDVDTLSPPKDAPAPAPPV